MNLTSNIPEQVLGYIIKQMPDVNGRKVSYHFGSYDELVRYLGEFKERNYPLVWLLPSSDTVSRDKIEKSCELIVCVDFDKEDEDVLNPTRYDFTFAKTLYPIADYLLEGITLTQATSYNDESFVIDKFPNYQETESRTPHLWDALKVTLNVQFLNDKCLKPIRKWQS